mmetsp:Transcript_9066/g.9115  ORF Transcript_9066/g.9115 Transcript_9066/m.9115 type:complete len:573 (-) Transcript_9066:209-1927(-)|eukprot:CAMPEP_0182425380 /NCGR_PEP_ID=MMETSP1167-20130531/11808_1 /TAXON_ID=2988 /ORGANISM="Mallomonas Sp, Strain CCMP3275" /LENGTH=572 /DNA_ID=CAMNT_0024606061 /DNA_START=155 /DNA_END=1873 /DNA_ORIENTATION=+
MKDVENKPVEVETKVKLAAVTKHRFLEDILNDIPVAFFHWRLLFMAGFGFIADAMEVNLLGFLSVCVGIEWELSHAEIASISSVVFVGQLLGAIFWGPFADKYGRRKSYIAASIFISGAGFLTGMAWNLPVLIFLRFLVGFGVGGLSVPFDLLAEFLPSSHRGRFLMYIELFWTAGSLLVSGIAWVSLGYFGWRFLAYMTALPVTLTCLVSIVYLPESARWHLDHKRYKEAEGIVKDVSIVNKHHLDDFTFVPNENIHDISQGSHSKSIDSNKSEHHANSRHDAISVTSAHTDVKSVVSEAKSITSDANDEPFDDSPPDTWYSTYVELLSSKRRFVSLPLWVTWLSFGFTYYGLILFVSRLFSTADEGESCDFEYESVFVNAVFEVVGVFLVAAIIDHIGRMHCQAYMYAAAGISVALMGSGLPPTTLIFVSGLGRLCITGAQAATWVATPELYPTKIRATGHSVATAMSRFGAAMCPFLTQSALSISIVGAVLCVVNFIAAASAMMLPETKGRALDHTVHKMALAATEKMKKALNRVRRRKSTNAKDKDGSLLHGPASSHGDENVGEDSIN